MVVPVKVNCRSEKPHIFEYFSILSWLSNPSNQDRCPSCLESDVKIQIAELNIHQKTGFKIHKRLRTIFVALEAFLNRLPKACFGTDPLPYFSKTELLAQLASKVRAGRPFLEEETEAVVQKIASGSLSEEEAYALGHYLVHQLKPMKDNVDQIYALANDSLVKFVVTGEIDSVTYQQQHEQLTLWYESHRIIPEECRTLHRLYQLKQ